MQALEAEGLKNSWGYQIVRIRPDDLFETESFLHSREKYSRGGWTTAGIPLESFKGAIEQLPLVAD